MSPPDFTKDKQDDSKRFRVITPDEDRRKGGDRRVMREADSDLVDSVGQRRERFKDFAPEEKRENVRGVVTGALVFLFCGCVILLVAFGLHMIGMHATNLKDALEGLSTIGGMVSACVVPIITFVLGFYFGSEKK